MTLNNILSNGSSTLEDKIKGLKDFNELKRLLNLNGKASEHDIIATCRILKHMQTELNLPPEISIKQLVSLYNKLTEIRAVFDLETNNFTQLNELFVEITTVREMADIPEDKPLPDLLFSLRTKNLSDFGLGKNSLLEKLLRYYIRQ